MTTITKVVATMPPFPQRGLDDADTYVIKADSTMAAMPTLITDINEVTGQINTVTGEVNTHKADAAIYAAQAAASAAASAASAAVNKWISGTTYTEGVCVWSPVDFQTYRHKSATGTRTTDPANDATNWTKISGSSGSTGAETRTASAVLSASSKNVQVLNMSAYGQTMKMADATTLTLGANVVIFDNTQGQYPVGILDGSNRVLGQVLPGDVVHFHLVGQATAAGTWRHSGNLDPWFTDSETALNLATNNGSVNWLSLDATRALLYYYTPTNNYPAVRLVTYNGAGVAPTVSNELVLKAAVTTIDTSNYALVGTSNRVLIRLQDDTVVCADLSNPSSITAGASASLTFTGGTLQKIISIDNQYLTAVVTDSGATLMRAKCIDCGASGTSVTVDAEATTSSYGVAPTYIFGKKVNSTTVGVFGRYLSGGTYYAAILHSLTRTSGTTLSWSANAGNPTGYRTDNSTQLQTYFDTTTDKLMLPFYRNGNLGSYVVVTFAASATPTFGSVVNSNVAAASLTFAVVGSPNRANFVGYVGGAGTAKNIENVTVSGSTVTVGAATSITADSTVYSSGPNMSIGIDDNGRGFVTWLSTIYGASGGRDKFRVFTTAANVFTFSPEINGTMGGAVNGMNQDASIADHQTTCGSGIFVKYANMINGTTSQRYGRLQYFKINADRTINTLAEFDLNTNSQTLSAYVGSPAGVFAGSLRNNPGNDPVAQNIVVWDGGGYKLGRTNYLNGASPYNNVSPPYQRPLPIMLINPDTKFGRNASLYTFRFAEA